MTKELRVHSIGGTIGEGINLYFANFLPLIFITAIINLPVIFYKLYIMEIGNTNPIKMLFASLIMIFAVLGAATISSGFFVQLISRNYMQHEKISIGAFISKVLPIIFPLLMLTFFTTLFTTFAFLLFIIPGIIIAIGLIVAPHVLVIERTGVFEAMTRSWELTKGSKFTIFAILILGGLITMVFAVLNLIVQAFAANHPITSLLAEYSINIISGPVLPCILVVVYFNLRIEKEGFNIEHLANQFTISE